MDNKNAKNIRNKEDVKRTRRTIQLEKNAKKLAKSGEFAQKKVQIVFY